MPGGHNFRKNSKMLLGSKLCEVFPLLELLFYLKEYVQAIIKESLVLFGVSRSGHFENVSHISEIKSFSLFVLSQQCVC
jgi:hypothetical protein